MAYLWKEKDALVMVPRSSHALGVLSSDTNPIGLGQVLDLDKGTVIEVESLSQIQEDKSRSYPEESHLNHSILLPEVSPQSASPVALHEPSI